MIGQFTTVADPEMTHTTTPDPRPTVCLSVCLPALAKRCSPLQPAYTCILYDSIRLPSRTVPSFFQYFFFSWIIVVLLVCILNCVLAILHISSSLHGDFAFSDNVYQGSYIFYNKLLNASKLKFYVVLESLEIA